MKDLRARILERLADDRPRHRPIRYAIYTRQSVERLADFSSCQAQFDTCRDLAEASGEPGQVWCGQHFDDEGQSGATLDRPAMQKLGKVICLGTQRIYDVTLDRITRSMRNAILLMDKFDKLQSRAKQNLWGFLRASLLVPNCLPASAFP